MLPRHTCRVAPRDPSANRLFNADATAVDLTVGDIGRHAPVDEPSPPDNPRTLMRAPPVGRRAAPLEAVLEIRGAENHDGEHLPQQQAEAPTLY